MMKSFILTAVLCLYFVPVSHAQDKTRITATNLENIEYPFPEHYITLRIQGETLKMEYMDVKPQQANGQTVLLLHGKNFCGAYWEQTAKDLSRHGYRVIIPDQIGFGKSSKPDRIQYSFQMLAMNTKAILDSLNISTACVLGHSMGGMVAVRFALMFPERTSRLILENPIGLEDWKVYIPYQTVEDWYRSELRQDYESVKKYQLVSYYGNKWRPEYDHWVNIFAGWSNNIDYPRIAWNSALIYDMIFTQPVCYEFQNIQVPSLLIIGQRDRTAVARDKAPGDIRDKLGNYPILGRDAASRIRNSKLVELDNVGHLPHIESYDRFIAPLIDFLDD